MSDYKKGLHDEELLRLLPRVLRARDFHLYTEGGKRLVDLWLQGGRAILGHKPPGVLLELKNAAERGLFTPLPHPLERRFAKALAVFFPDRLFRFYNDPSSMYHAVEKALSSEGAPFQCSAIPDPAFPAGKTMALAPGWAAGRAAVSLWRPFVNDEETPILIPVLPWPLGPAVLVLDKSMEASFPQGELIPPVLLAPAARALYDLAALIRVSGRQRYYRIEKALADARSGEGSTNGVWQRRGIYLTTRLDREKYAQLFRSFLEAGFLLPPSAGEPVILPASMSKGEETQLAKLLAD
jgi:hypothetical protein